MSGDNNRIGSIRRPDPATMASVSPLPPPEEVFIDWLMSVPHGVDIEEAACRQIAVIDRHVSLHPDVQHLRTLLLAVAGSGPMRRSRLRSLPIARTNL